MRYNSHMPLNHNKIASRVACRLIEADMANISPDEHHFGINVTLNVMQPGERKYKHGPRIKVYSQDPDTNFSLAINKTSDEVEVIGDPATVMRRRDLPRLVSSVKKYRYAFLLFWYDRTMSTSGLQKLMRRIDAGENLKADFDALLASQ